MTNSITEQELQGKAVAPRVTAEQIDSKIKGVEYIFARDVCKRDNGVEIFDAPLSLQTLTFCILTLENGFTVTGESACASPENFDAEIGKKIAYDNAREKIWQLEGYLLKENLYKAELEPNTEHAASSDLPVNTGSNQAEGMRCKSTGEVKGEACCAGPSPYNNYQELDVKLMKGRFLIDVLVNSSTQELSEAASTKLKSIVEGL